MPRVHTQRANKSYPEHGINKGDTYYWWKFRHGGKIKSKTPPRPSQLTQSEYLGRVYDLQDSTSSQLSGAESIEDIQSIIEGIASDIRELATEQEDKLSNMPDQLQSAPSGELLSERAECCNEAADSLEGMDFSKDDDEDEDAAVMRLADEARDFIGNLQ